jgi:hypothetical protein
MWDIGSAPLTSTQAEATDPSTSALIAAVTGLSNAPYELRLVCGASTLAKFILEQSQSSTLADALETSPTAGHMGRRTFFTQTNASAQYALRFKAESGSIVRLRVTATAGGALGGGTAQAAGTIQLERLS